MAASTLMLSFLLASAAAVCAGAAGVTNTTVLDTVCSFLGGYYVTPELCTSVLCHDPSSPCRAARDGPAVAALAARLAAANVTAARDSVAAAAAAAAAASTPDAETKAGLRACLQLYTGAAAALEWAAGSVAAGRLAGAREVLQAAQYVSAGCDGMVAGEAMPKENGGFDTMVIVAHAVVASLSTAY